MERFRPLLLAARLDQAFLAPCAVFVGSSFARFDAQPGPGLPAHVVVSIAALLAAAGVNLIDHAWDRWGAPAPDPKHPVPEVERPLEARDAAIAGSSALAGALLVGAALVPLSGGAAIGYGLAAVVLGVLRGAPIAGLDTLGRGLGDLANVAALGPLAVLAGFASQCGHGSTGAAIVGVPVGIAAGAALYTRHFTRQEADLRHDRLTPVTVFGDDRARLGLVVLPLLAMLAGWAVVGAEEAPAGTLAAGAPLAILAGFAWLASRDPSCDFDRFGRLAAVGAAATLLTLAVALRLAVR